ncbi:MAG: hypothetical protein KDH88_12975 [Chromatiales bacterium]|nr:hypothetical protein [Chromatiales bacterium]
MLSKILLTLLVIIVAFIVIGARSSSVREGEPSRPTTPSAGAKPSRKAWLIGGVVALLLIASLASILYRNWQYGQELVSVRVVNIQSGQAQIYRTRRANIEGRSFNTLDGRTVTVADMERVEVIEGDVGAKDIRLP